MHTNHHVQWPSSGAIWNAQLEILVHGLGKEWFEDCTKQETRLSVEKSFAGPQRLKLVYPIQRRHNQHDLRKLVV